jgi:hypothetical protein
VPWGETLPLGASDLGERWRCCNALKSRCKTLKKERHFFKCSLTTKCRRSLKNGHVDGFHFVSAMAVKLERERFENGDKNQNKFSFVYIDVALLAANL